MVGNDIVSLLLISMIDDIKHTLSSGESSPMMYDGVPECPSLFQDIRISSTETAKETGAIGSSYTLYILEVCCICLLYIYICGML